MYPSDSGVYKYAGIKPEGAPALFLLFVYKNEAGL